MQAQGAQQNGARPPNNGSPGIHSITPASTTTGAVKATPSSHVLPNGASPRTAFAQLAATKLPRGQTQFTPDMRVFTEAQRLQAEQQAFLQAQRQQSNTPNNNITLTRPASSSGLHANGLPEQGRQSPVVHNSPRNTHLPPSPRGTNPISSGNPAAIPAGLSQIQNQLKARHPNATPIEIQRLTSEHLYRLSQQSLLTQSGLSKGTKAKGSSSPSPIPGGLPPSGGTINQTQYAQFMRTQQATQQRTPGSGPERPASSSNGLDPPAVNGVKNVPQAIEVNAGKRPIVLQGDVTLDAPS